MSFSYKRVVILVLTVIALCGVASWWNAVIEMDSQRRHAANEWFEHPSERTFCAGYWSVARERGAKSAYLDKRCDSYQSQEFKI